MLKHLSKKLVLVAMFGVALSIAESASAMSQTTGTIGTMYVGYTGAIAFKMSVPFVNASTECPGNNGWAGNYSLSKTSIAALYMAKESGLTVTVTISGCEGSWLNVTDVYIQ